MVNNLHNLVVFIKDEAELHQAREILITNGEHIATDGTFVLSKWRSEDNYLQIFASDGDWWITDKDSTQIEITLPELEQLLKQKQNEQNNS